MAVYMGLRIIEGAYSYEYVCGKRPDLKDGIDAYLVQQGREELIQKDKV
ncbi:hypothetical protein [Paenibacillus sp. JJ-223]|nr:hypothetical protein [Paenibacillus sp. JJ-223]CAH1203921.1 hypothetical protein PAECIP111890_02397 [Paenibacillus sp. JJ-223]